MTGLSAVCPFTVNVFFLVGFCASAGPTNIRHSTRALTERKYKSLSIMSSVLLDTGGPLQTCFFSKSIGETYENCGRKPHCTYLSITSADGVNRDTIAFIKRV